jgi:hypothetical protein
MDKKGGDMKKVNKEEIELPKTKKQLAEFIIKTVCEDIRSNRQIRIAIKRHALC